MCLLCILTRRYTLVWWKLSNEHLKSLAAINNWFFVTDHSQYSIITDTCSFSQSSQASKINTKTPNLTNQYNINMPTCNPTLCCVIPFPFPFQGLVQKLPNSYVSALPVPCTFSTYQEANIICSKGSDTVQCTEIAI